ncbi:phospholipase A2 [Ilyonectria robusta]|uniref:phospholipase A2 n=1 Tax=Ilyonectria robusta TaxID=1079257 RepID=UPI001E8D7A1F|nr:phospholipase A2 [Ilyonectria robusta]KAH6981361.1 phospholipase A2 [Ilyonectria sp. MPI-CAGE-AT-0026]KAH8722318.1 phospholipase A2 [Ilyonectria robusta]
MKFTTPFVLLLSGVSAIPTKRSEAGLMSRATIQETTDELLFTLTLPQFTARRNAQNPSTLDWTSDGCTSSPDNPLGFPFVPACNRHDFGYNNYRAQTRFTESAKLKIDNNFKTDLYYQCTSVTLSSICRALADVYYAAVRAFGGSDATPGKRSTDELVKIYEEKLAIYNDLVAEARANGDLPPLDSK